MTVQRLACTKQSPTSYIQEFGAMDVLIDENRYNHYMKQQLQEAPSTQQENFIILQNNMKYGLVRYLHGACCLIVQSVF